jgi:penicillin-binding protein 2
LTGQYPPGSTTKFITVGAGLEEGLITENSTFKPCLGGFRFGDRVFHCWKLSGHGSLNLTGALEQSCDIYMYQLGLQLGVDGLAKYYGKSGFGRPTGVELAGEMPGLNPDSEYYDKRYGKKKWTRGLALNNSIGQGELLSTPLQLTQFFCGLANNGVVYRPHLVKRVSKPNGEATTVTPKQSFTLPFSKATLALLNNALRLVVEGDHGTAKSLKNDLYSIGGKTGTAQNPHGNEHSLFVGVAPLENPEIVVCAIIENAGHGSEVAAPVVGKVIRAYMTKKMGLDMTAAPDSGVVL